jgi:hypothetical protein
MRVFQNTPAMALGIADHVWSIGELLDTRLRSPRHGRSTRRQIDDGDSKKLRAEKE